MTTPELGNKKKKNEPAELTKSEILLRLSKLTTVEEKLKTAEEQLEEAKTKVSKLKKEKESIEKTINHTELYKQLAGTKSVSEPASV